MIPKPSAPQVFYDFIDLIADKTILLPDNIRGGNMEIISMRNIIESLSKVFNVTIEEVELKLHNAKEMPY